MQGSTKVAGRSAGLGEGSNACWGSYRAAGKKLPELSFPPGRVVSHQGDEPTICWCLLAGEWRSGTRAQCIGSRAWFFGFLTGQAWLLARFIEFPKWGA
jgi:hypothetical protein